MLHPKALPTSQQLAHLRQELKLMKKKMNNLTLFDKLQYYDKIVSSFNVSRVDAGVLHIFEQILDQHVEEEQKNMDNIHYSSPPSHKRDQIEDPQLFSFSKTRKEQKGQPIGSTVLAKTRIPGIKHKNNTDEPKHHNFAQTKNDISEFMENQQIQSQVHSSSVHQLTKTVRNMVIRRRLAVLIKNGRSSIKQRRNILKIRSSEYLYELNLIKKCMKILQQHRLWNKNVVKWMEQMRQSNTMELYFRNWRQYAFRSQQQRQEQREINRKYVFLCKKLSIAKFIHNSGRIMDNNEGEMKTYGEYLRQVNKDLNQKQNALIKRVYIQRMINRSIKKQQIPNKYHALSNLLKGSQFKIFTKLLKCYYQIQNNKQQLMHNKVRKTVFANTFISKIKQEYFFQKSYWVASHNHDHQGLLDCRYQKIVFLKQIFDISEHSLQRKGYFIQQPLSAIIEQHPAYEKFYKPFKLKKYFQALKSQITNNYEKQKLIKYGIKGRKVYESMLCWYRDQIQSHISQQQIYRKSNQLKQILWDRRKVDLLNCLSKMTQRKEQQLIQNMIEKRKVRTLKILKAYKISKRYYVNSLHQHNNRTMQRIKQSCFLSWKLLQAEKMHQRLLVKQCRQLRKRFALRQIVNQIDQNGLTDRIHRKKMHNLIRCRAIDYGEIFIDRLFENYQAKRQSTKISFKNQSQAKQKVLQVINGLKAKHFIHKLHKNWKFRILTKRIHTKIDQQYQNRTKFKIFRALLACKQYKVHERHKMEQITGKVNKNRKKQMIQLMAGQMVRRIVIKRALNTLRKAYLDFGLSVLMKNI